MAPSEHFPEASSERHDVVVIGGGAAGLSAAVTLARALRSVLVIDAGTPRNTPAAGVHGYLTREGTNPSVLLDVGRTEAESYGVPVLRGEVSTLNRTDGGFEAGLIDGRRVLGRRVLVATGLTDGLPDIPGLREQWGRGVVHCPYCHGYEIRHQRIGVLATGPMSLHQALLFRQWSEDITFFPNDVVALTDEDRERCAARSIRVIEGPVTAVGTDDGVLSGVVVSGEQHVDLQALAVGTRMEANSTLLESLGLETQDHPSGMGRFVEPGPMGSTTVPGVYVAGNVSNLSAQVIVAAAEGTMAGAMINAHLIEEETAAAVEQHRGDLPTAGPEGPSGSEVEGAHVSVGVSTGQNGNGENSAD